LWLRFVGTTMRTGFAAADVLASLRVFLYTIRVVQPVAGENMNKPPRRSRKRVVLAHAGVAVGAHRVVIIQDNQFVRPRLSGPRPPGSG
jgi:hypothetical protein